MTYINGGPELERALAQGRENARRGTWKNVADEHDRAVDVGEFAHPDDGGGLEDDAHFWASVAASGHLGGAARTAERD